MAAVTNNFGNGVDTSTNLGNYNDKIKNGFKEYDDKFHVSSTYSYSSIGTQRIFGNYDLKDCYIIGSYNKLFALSPNSWNYTYYRESMPTIFICMNIEHTTFSNANVSLKLGTHGNILAKFKPLQVNMNGTLCDVFVKQTNGSYLRVEIEEEQSGNFAFVSSANPSKLSFRPYEEIDLSGIKVNVNNVNVTRVSSKECVIASNTLTTYSTWNDIKTHATSITTDLPTAYYCNETYVNKDYVLRVNYKDDSVECASNNGVKNLLWTLHISDFEEKVYDVTKKQNASYGIYLGKEVGNDFLNAYQVIRNYKNGGETKYSQVITSNIEKSKMSTKIPNENKIDYAKGASFDFVYTYDNQKINVSIKENLHLLHNLNKFNLIKVKNTYNVGDIVKLKEIVENVKQTGYLTYDDNTTISVLDSKFNIVASCSLGDTSLTEFTIGEDTSKNFTITLQFVNSSLFKDITTNITCQVVGYSDDYVDHVSLINAKTNFVLNDTLGLGDSAVLVLYNHANSELGRLTKTQIEQSQDITLDTNYNKKITVDNLPSITNNAPITLKGRYNNNGIKEFSHTFNVSYPKELKIDSSKVENPVYFKKDTKEFIPDFTKLTATIIYENNENGTHEEQEIDVKEQVSITHNAIDTRLDYKQYTISVSIIHSGKTFTKTFTLDVYKLKPIQAILNDKVDFWDNDSDVFHAPKGTIKFNNNATEEFNVENNSVNFYRDSAHTIPLTIGESIIKSNEGSAIYFECVDNPSVTRSSYPITFKDDHVTSIAINNEPTFTLGNKINALYNILEIKVTYESGKNENTNFKGYEFITEKVGTDSGDRNNPYILEPLEELKINTYDCYQSISKQNTNLSFNKQETLDISSITFKYPKVKMVDVDDSKFTTYYNNGVGKINVKVISFKVYYEGADYVQVINKYVKAKSEKYDEFSVTAVSSDEEHTTIVELSDYNYDGSQVVTLSLLDSEVEKQVKLVFSLNTIFKNETSKIEDITKLIRVIDITDITGIALVANTLKQVYYVGDTFLNDDDTTQITLYYRNVKSEQARLTINLKDGFPALNIFPLKGTLFQKVNNAISVRITAATNNNVSLEYTISVQPNYTYEDKVESVNLRVVRGIYNKVSEDVERYYIVDDSNTEVVNGVRRISSGLTLNDTSIHVYGYLEDVNDTRKNARVVFFEDYLPPIDGESNIKVKYPCYIKGNGDYINHCHIGHLFGNNNAKNRLFVSGNPDYINCDWHSGAVNTDKQTGDKMNENGDFTYFEDASYCFYGQTDNKIVGYDIISNDKMVVLKSKSDKEPTIYYRTNGLIQAIDGGGNNQLGLNNTALYEESYPLVTGNIGAGALSNRSIINFNGDTLFISSDNQVDGLDVVGIIGDSQRYANTRSLFINPYLKQYDLSKAQFFTNNKYLYLVLPNCLFVTYFEKYNASTKQYEWFKLDIPNISYMIEYNDKMYYSTHDGKLYALENGIFSDKQRIFVSAGSFSNKVNVESDTILASQDLINKLDNSDDYRIQIVANENDYNSYMYQQIATISSTYPINKDESLDLYANAEENCLEVVGIINGEENQDRKNILMNTIKDDGRITYYLNIKDTQHDIANGNDDFVLGKGIKLQIYYNDRHSTNEKYKVYDADNGKELQAKAILNATLCLRMDGEYFIKNVDKQACTFELHDNNGKVNVIQYDSQNLMQSNQAIITRYDKISAYYIKAPNTLGNLMYNKTIWSWTITNDTNLESSVEICYATNDIDFKAMEQIVSLTKMESGLKLDDIKTLVDLYKHLTSDNMQNVRKSFYNKYGVTIDDISVDKINFNRFIIPHKYTFYRPLNAPFICFGFKNVAGENAVLCTMQVLYTIPMASIGR